MTITHRPQTTDRRPQITWRSAVGRRRSFIVQASIYATIVVAFFLRVYRLADKNIWWDEGWSIWLSQKDLAWIALRTAADEHPPLYYWMLHFWNALAGSNAFAGRFLSVAFGALTIVLLYRIGKRVGSAWIGLLAALFLAVARFHIWWSQDIKNYTPSIFFAFAAVWFALDILERANKFAATQTQNRPSSVQIQSPQGDLAKLLPANSFAEQRTAVVGYTLCAALAMWTHYLAALILLALNVYAAIVFARIFYVSRFTFYASRHWHIGTLAHWLIANALAAALFAPWMYLYLQNAATWSAAPAFDFGLFLELVATVLPLGVTTHIENYAALTIALAMIAALGCVNFIASEAKQSPRDLGIASSHPSTPLRSAQDAPRNDTLLFALIVALPPILIYVLSLTPVSFFAPKIQARYLLVLLPAYVMLLALGVALLRRFSLYLALAATFFVLVSSAFVLNDYYAERRLRDEYTTLADTINAFAHPDDLVLLDTDQEWPTFLYYLRAPLEPPSNLGVTWLGVPNGKAMTEADADALARRALNRSDAVWLVAIPDALATDPQRLLETRLARELPKQFERAFGDKRLALFAPAPRDLINVSRENFAPQFARAQKIADGLELLGFDLSVREARAGDILRVVTYWNARNTGNVAIGLGDIVTTTVRVPSGERVRIQSDSVIPPGARGDVSVVVGMVELARVRIEARAEIERVGDIAHRADYRLGDAIHLVGYDLPQTKFRAGETVAITLYWRADRAVEKSYTAFVHLLGAQFNAAQNNFLWGQVDRIPREGAYPTAAWLPSEIVPDTYRVPIDPRAPAGVYKIEVGLYDAATGTRLAVDGGGDSLIVAEIEIK